MSLATQLGNSRQKIRCLVIQLTSLGDTLQSLMALRAANQLYPDLEIHFLTRECFAHATKRVPWIKKVITLPTEDIIHPIINNPNNERESLTKIAKWIEPLLDEPWDFLVNWSYSQSSSYLTGLIPARIKLGYSRSNDNRFTSVDGWSDYIQAILQGGSTQNIHLTDILTTQILTALQIHIGDPTEGGNAPVTSKHFFSLELDEKDIQNREKNLNSSFPGLHWGEFSTRKRIGLQLRFGDDDQTWNIKNWALLAFYILKNNPECDIVLLGENKDLERYHEFQSELRNKINDLPNIQKRILSLIGETDFDLWASSISRCHWLIANNTAAIHLASVLGTRVLNISIGDTRWLETGPYGNGHYVIESSVVTPEIAYATWSYGISEWSHQRKHTLLQHLIQLGWDNYAETIRVYRSKIRGAQEGGGVCYESLLKSPFRLEDWTAMVMGHIARSWYCGWAPPVGQELSRSMMNPLLLKSLRELDESSEVLLKVCEEARKTSLTLKLKSAHLKSEKIMKLGDREELKSLGKKILDLDNLMERLGKTHFPLLPFTRMSKVMMHNLKGTQLTELGTESAESYRLLTDGVKILREWIKYSIELAKPTMVLESITQEVNLL